MSDGFTESRKRPGGAIASRDLDFFWLVDTSYSMDGVKLGQLNFAMQEALAPMRQAARANPTVKVFVRTITFSSTAQFVDARRVALEDYEWQPLLTASGLTATGDALRILAQTLAGPDFPAVSYPPVIVLLTDGYPTDNLPGGTTFQQGLAELLATVPGKNAVRLGIAIGDQADLATLNRFIDDPQIPVLRARTASGLAEYVKWASSVAIERSTTPRRRDADRATNASLDGPIVADLDGDLVWHDDP